MEPGKTVIAGVDTHKDRHVLCLLDGVGRKIFSASYPADKCGYGQLAKAIGNPSRCLVVGVEGTASFGAGLSTQLISMGYPVVEVLRPKRDKRRKGRGKNDEIDAEIAARDAASENGTSVPKSRDGWVEGIRTLMVARDLEVQTSTKVMNAVKSLLVTAPEGFRAKYREYNGSDLMERISRSRTGSEDVSSGALMAALKSLARTWLELERRSLDLRKLIEDLLFENAPALLEVPGCGAINAADLAIAAGDNPERLGSESAFAALCGASPIEASSGKVTRHRLNKGGNRSANRALHMIVVNRMRYDERTVTYVKRRISENETKREAMRCLKRYVAREIYSVLLDPTATVHPRGDELAARRNVLGMSQKGIAEKLGVPNVRISEIEGEKRLCPGIRAEYDRLLSVLLENQIQA
jgi:transposase